MENSTTRIFAFRKKSVSYELISEIGSVILQPLLDLFFPPLCMNCKEFTSMPYLCKECWLGSQLLDPEGRCLHCFHEIGEPSGLCLRCRHKPLLPFPRAALFAKEAPICRLMNREESPKPLAGYAFYQWLRLHWKEPDLIAPIPPERRQVAREFGELAQVPCPNLFRRVPWPLYPRVWEVKEQMIEDEMTVLLIDEGCTFIELQMACRVCAEAFPKNVYILSLIL